MNIDKIVSSKKISATNVQTEKPRPKVILSLLSQQYGLTVEDLLERFPNLSKEDIEVEKLPK